MTFDPFFVIGMLAALAIIVLSVAGHIVLNQRERILRGEMRERRK